MLAVVPVGALRIRRVPVDRDPYRVPDHRFRAGVVEVALDSAPVHTVHIGQCGGFVLDHPTGPGGAPPGRPRPGPRPGRRGARTPPPAVPVAGPPTSPRL